MSSTPATRFRRKVGYGVAVAGDIALRGSRRLLAEPGGETLEGDRWVEWSFCIARMAEGEGTTMDFGADLGFLSLSAAYKGHKVVALDRMDIPLVYTHPNVERVTADILDRPLSDRRFDQIVNCSSVEHVGLGGRYGSGTSNDGDLEAMGVMADMLAEGGRMILTIPVGRDGVYAPAHRVYGEERLPRLLERFTIDEELYWTKHGGDWKPADRAAALAVQGSESFYALGLFVLVRR